MREFTARFATAEEIENWDKQVTADPNGGNMLQSDAYAAVKDGNGWLVRRLVIETAQYSSYNLLLEKKFPVLGRLWYVIKGPDAADVDDLKPMLTAVAKLAREQKMNVFSIKIEPDIIASEAVTAQLKASGLVRAPISSRTTPPRSWTPASPATRSSAASPPGPVTLSGGPSVRAVKSSRKKPARRATGSCTPSCRTR